MKVKTSELNGKALAYAVGIAEGCKIEYWHTKAVAILFPEAPRAVPWNPHSDWNQGGPIIERERISVISDYKEIEDGWLAEGYDNSVQAFGPTPLIAAMRCYCASKLGDEIDIPEELLR